MKYLRTAAFVCLTLLPAAGFARGGRGGGGPHGQGNIMKMAEELSLTEIQKTEIKKIQKTGKEQAQAQKAALKEAKKALGETVSSATATKEQLLAAHEKFAQAKLEMMRLQFAKLVEMRSLLTPEQLAKLPKVAPLDRVGDDDRNEDGDQGK